jgi:hypothetical protein
MMEIKSFGHNFSPRGRGRCFEDPVRDGREPALELPQPFIFEDDGAFLGGGGGHTRVVTTGSSTPHEARL